MTGFLHSSIRPRGGPIAVCLLLLAGLLGVALAVPGPSRAEEEPNDGRPIEGDQTESDAADEQPLVVPSRVRSTPERGSARDPSGSPGLDSLLQLPSGFMSERSRPVAGASESEWRRRFDRSVSELAEARRTLEKTKVELDEVAESGGSSQWSVAPPGGGGAANGGGGASAASSPLSFKLRQELKRNRESVEQAERDLRELRIEADLAGVPQSWRGGDQKAGRTQRN